MVIPLIYVLLLICSVTSETLKLPINPNRLEFDLWPYKKWEVDGSSDASSYQTCFEMNTNIKAKDLQFLIEIEEFTKWKVNVDRFGPTTSSKGKQVVNMDIYDEDQNLVQSRHGLENGETVLYVSVYEHQNFQICLINFSLDSSWNAIDSVKQVAISITSNDLIQKQKWDLITDDDLNVLSQGRDVLFSLVSADSGQELHALDVDHRNLNESTFSYLLAKVTILFCIIGLCHLLVFPFLLYRIVSKGQPIKNKNKIKR
ncbi:Rrt6 [Kluyveromyces lactis]|nr:Rrt6 [Kluyveromyces lactis]